MKTMIIDDDAFARKLLTRQLAKLGVTDIAVHSGGGAALDDIANAVESVDLIFCDLQMPEMDGVECVRALSRIAYAGRLILISGEDDRILRTAESVATARGLNVLGRVNKPITPEQLGPLLDAARSDVSQAAADYSVHELQRAIDNDDLVNFYQPQIELRTGAVAGVESLVRWEHPRDGRVPPARFIPLAEKSGLIDALTRNVIHNGLQQLRIWQEEGLNTRLAINVSMNSLGMLDFPDFVEREAADVQIPLDRLTLEITETQLMDDVQRSLDTLTRLRLKTIGLAVDDFGIGHTSIAQLRDIPFSELKIDRSFVHDAHVDPSRGAFLKGILDMARQLGMATVAEGVETEDDLRFLRNLGTCDVAQGFFFAKPMSGEDLSSWVADSEPTRSRACTR